MDSKLAGLYIVSTPIGNLEDITLRALKVLKACDRIACEDSRISFKLLSHYDIHKPLIPYHNYSSEKVRDTLINFLSKGECLALISDAGTPLISDPGYKLVQKCLERNIPVTTVPGPTAFVSAGILSGFPLNIVTFIGFFSQNSQTCLQELQKIPGSIIGFESPHKIQSQFERLARFFPNRQIAVVREITKFHEQVIRGDYETVINYWAQNQPKGEMVIVLSPLQSEDCTDKDLQGIILQSLKEHNSLHDAVAVIAQQTGLKKNHIYEMALKLKHHLSGFNDH